MDWFNFIWNAAQQMQIEHLDAPQALAAGLQQDFVEEE